MFLQKNLKFEDMDERKMVREMLETIFHFHHVTKATFAEWKAKQYYIPMYILQNLLTITIDWCKEFGEYPAGWFVESNLLVQIVKLPKQPKEKKSRGKKEK